MFENALDERHRRFYVHVGIASHPGGWRTKPSAKTSAVFRSVQSPAGCLQPKRRICDSPKASVSMIGTFATEENVLTIG